MDFRIRFKAKDLLPSCEGRQVEPKKNHRAQAGELLRLIFQSRMPLLCLGWLFSGVVSPILAFEAILVYATELPCFQ